MWTTEKRWVRAAKHCELERERSFVSDAVSLEKESKSMKLAMLGSGLGGNVTTPSHLLHSVIVLWHVSNL